ncbi:uncharacterized protein [Panulirus ornatus]|uniref:uncharacterized protein n=1 Tax=Panulirus ornatus TaxID=150431 RepID=UPI003A8948F2
MNLMVLACLATVVVGAPQFGRQFVQQQNTLPRQDYRPIAIVSYNRQDYGDGQLSYDFETENGIAVNAVSSQGLRGQSNIQGSYSFPLPDGTYAEVRYVADEEGFRAESPLIPTPHPLPAHAIEQIRIAEEQRRQGIPLLAGHCPRRVLSTHTHTHTSSMKFVVLACLAAMTVAAPQILDERPVVQIIRDDRQDDGNGNYNYAYEADNGIAVEASGAPGSEGQAIMKGVYSFPLPDGRIAEVRYNADENGFQPQTDLLPTPHPLPAHVVENIRISQELAAAGATFDDQGRRLTR